MEEAGSELCAGSGHEGHGGIQGTRRQKCQDVQADWIGGVGESSEALRPVAWDKEHRMW